MEINMKRQEKVIEELTKAQCDDGSFGRFHTMNTKEKKKIPTTEAAAWLMYQNGISLNIEVCNKMCIYMEHLLCNLQEWPDLWEKNKYFDFAVPLFISSKLALFHRRIMHIKEIETFGFRCLFQFLNKGSIPLNEQMQ